MVTQLPLRVHYLILLLKEVRCDENKMLIFYLDVVLFLLLLSVIEACNPKGNFPFGLHNLISFLRMKLNAATARAALALG